MEKLVARGKKCGGLKCQRRLSKIILFLKNSERGFLERKTTPGSLRVPRNPFISRSKSPPENRWRLCRSLTFWHRHRANARRGSGLVLENLLCVRRQWRRLARDSPVRLSVFLRNFSYGSVTVRWLSAFREHGNRRILSVGPFVSGSRRSWSGAPYEALRASKKIQCGWLSELSRRASIPMSVFFRELSHSCRKEFRDDA